MGISSPTRDWTLVSCVESRGVLTTRLPRKSREIDSSYKSVEANEETKLLLIWSFFWNDENQVACVSAWMTRLLSEVSYKNVELWHVTARMSYSRKISEQQEFTKSDVTGLQKKKWFRGTDRRRIRPRWCWKLYVPLKWKEKNQPGNELLEF